MRLRRETGDFQIVVKTGETEGTYVVNSIRPGLSAEDFVGEVVAIPDGSFLAIVSTHVDLVNGKIVAIAIGNIGNEFTFTYDPATGGITFMASGSGSITPSIPGLTPTPYY